ncbi:MAG TPA: hypothetical protein VE547_21895, partial [Mycobacteriales bacterium]|nr:hypothetical protein [Mycobacteriales bacterium]
MTTNTRTATGRTTVDGATGRRRRLRIGAAVAISMVTGLATALVLVLVAFAGATEAVITGAALLGFASGWALLAVLTARLTDQPQRWAAVPAVVMAAAGAGLLASAPGDGALTAAGWVWPPAALALV